MALKAKLPAVRPDRSSRYFQGAYYNADSNPKTSAKQLRMKTGKTVSLCVGKGIRDFAPKECLWHRRKGYVQISVQKNVARGFTCLQSKCLVRQEAFWLA